LNSPDLKTYASGAAQAAAMKAAMRLKIRKAFRNPSIPFL
jgi:hypothetical protein